MIFNKILNYLLNSSLKENKLKYFFTKNIYGLYCIPISAKHRPACKIVLRNEVYEQETISFILNNYVNGDIIHAGTFFGDFLPALSKKIGFAGKIWAFEPNSENFKCTQITLLINDLENVNLFKKALGETNSKGFLKIKENEKMLGGGSKLVPEPKSADEIVEIVSLDEIVPFETKISIIHLDVEGYEEFVLKGGLQLIKRCKPILLLEDNKNFCKSIWFEENILNLGYNFIAKVNDNSIFRLNGHFSG